MSIPDQKISEVTPKTLSSETRTRCGSDGSNTVWTVYSGLVPMSPNTTPSAPSASAACPPPRLVLTGLTLQNALAASQAASRQDGDPLAEPQPAPAKATRRQHAN